MSFNESKFSDINWETAADSSRIIVIFQFRLISQFVF